MLKELIAMTMIEYAMSFMGTHYTWGGNTAEEGFDCSGFVCEVLKSEEYLENKTDLTSQQLYDVFLKRGLVSGFGANHLVFYGKSTTEITHVAFMINNNQVIEAAGEGRANTKKGFVRVRPVNYRGDVVASLKL